MSDPARKPATYQDVLNAPEHMIAEVIDGELQLHPRPGLPHSSIATVIGADVFPYARRRGGGSGQRWRILFEPEIHLDDQIVVPDVAGWRFERLPHIVKQAYTTVAPDWVCEVLSPRTVRTDRTSKKRIYARHGVEFLWMVDPAAQTLEVFRLSGDFWQELVVHAGDERVRVPPFEELELDLGAWWEEETEDLEGPGGG